MERLFFVVVGLFTSVAFSDELISVRCQTKCLDVLQQTYHDHADMRRQMKHHVVNVCKDDINCSACTEPCRESFTTLAECRSTFCAEVSAEARGACEESCLFLQKIYSEKPGECPAFDSGSTVYECAASCHLDGDCPETSKCCSVGCSRKCLAPSTNSSSLLPTPTAISVTERKRRRSAVVRWVMKKMTHAQTAALSNLYVLQWRWGLHEDAMTEWQTILIRNKMYAILKHLLSPGRIYQFRVAAVSTGGSLGFSAPSVPFKLSKEARAPISPRLTLGTSRLSASGQWSQQIQWVPPASDLPIKNYEVSWQDSSPAEADAFEGRIQAALKRSTKEDDEDDSVDGFSLGGFGGTKAHHSSILASHETNTMIEGLEPDSVYIVEVHASVDSSEGELHGEKGIIFIRTAGLSPTGSSKSLDDVTPSSISAEIDSGSFLRIGTPHIDHGKLVASVNWIDAAMCISRASYVLRIRRESCVDGPGSEWEERILAACSTTLDGLKFACRYTVSVSRQGEEESASLSTSFSTSDCPSTHLSTPDACRPPSPLTCTVESFVVLCHWPHSPSTATESTIGYRVSLKSAAAGTSHISIVPPQFPQTTFQNLAPNTEFEVEVQPITSRGDRAALTTVFRTGPGSGLVNDVIDGMVLEGGGETIELPLESGAPWNALRWSPVLLLLLALCLRIRL